MNRTVYLLILFWLFTILYALLSYSLTDPNLVLINHPIYWQFQNWMWQTFFHNSLLLTQVYLLVATGWFVVFLWLLFHLKGKRWQLPKPSFKIILIYLLVISPIFFAYNALSHDVFNYIFNARMVVEYGTNPHQSVALEFTADEWTRFMHNTHTPAPYGYGWTGLSVLPYVAGLGKFITTWLAFRIFNLISLFGLLVALIVANKQWFRQPIELWKLALVFLNPLVLIEVVGNFHNDLWMMVPAMLAFLFLAQIKTFSPSSFKWLLLAIVSLLLSISVKYATLVLLPLVFVVFVEKSLVLNMAGRLRIGILQLVPSRVQEKIMGWLDDKLFTVVPPLASILMFLPLITSRSQQFHPWYLIWPLVWIPLIKQKWWWQLLLVFSISSLWRYAPWLLAGGFEGDVLLQQKLITWLPAGIMLIYLWAKREKHRPKQSPLQPLKEISDQI